MAKKPSDSAEPWVPHSSSLKELRSAAEVCKGCDLYKNATQTVFGKGPAKARVVFIGEQPGDQEDRVGDPFVGPAGKLLDRALADAGIDRATVHVTNVKHFKFATEGKRRIHERPSAREIAGCRPWLEAEMDALHPEVIVCLGAAAAKAVFGNAYRVTKQRGTFVEHRGAKPATSTLHPSAILRTPDEAGRQQQYADFVSDLKKVHKHLPPSHSRTVAKIGCHGQTRVGAQRSIACYARDPSTLKVSLRQSTSGAIADRFFYSFPGQRLKHSLVWLVRRRPPIGAL